MKVILGVLFFLVTIPELSASRTRPHPGWSVYKETPLMDEESFRRSVAVTLPEVTYEEIKSQGLLKRKWGNFFDANSSHWHLHWAPETQIDAKEAFSLDAHKYKIKRLDGSEVSFENWSVGPLSATYILSPLEKNEKEVRIVPRRFFLCVPQFCRIDHELKERDFEKNETIDQ